MERDVQEQTEELIDLGAASVETQGGFGGNLEASRVGLIPGITAE